MKKHPSSWKKIDTIAMILFPMVATTLSLLLQTNFFWSTMFFFGFPALYFALRNPKKAVKALPFVLPIGFVAGLLFDYLAIRSGAWVVPTTIFPFRIFGSIPIEDLIWGTLLVFNVVLYYEHFYDKGNQKEINKNFKYAVLLLLIVSLLITFLFVFYSKALDIEYFYIKAGVILFLIPTVTYLSFVPKLISKYSKVGTYFFAQGLLFELTGLHLKQWIFAGTEYIGWVEIATLRFPLEEFLFWLVLFAVTILSYYEFFYDDGK